MAERTQSYESEKIEWRGISIIVRYCPNWHTQSKAVFEIVYLEVVRANRIAQPITETVYKSKFINPPMIKQSGRVLAFVRDCLAVASRSKESGEILEDQLQGCLP